MKQTISLLIVLGILLCSCNGIKRSHAANTGKEMNKETAKEATENQDRRQFASALSGEWELTYIEGIPKEFDQFYTTKKPVLRFNMAANQVSGHTSCNTFSGPFTINQSRIDLKGPMKMTKMYCEGGGEEAFLEALQRVTSFSSDGNTLDLIAGDIGIMQFQRM